MQFLFIVFGLATVVVLAILLMSVVVGISLCINSRLRPIGILVLLVPSLSAIAAGAGSWGLAFFVDALSARATSAQASQTLQALTFWAWPIGFVAGGVVGAIAGVFVAFLIIKRLPPPVLPTPRAPSRRQGE